MRVLKYDAPFNYSAINNFGARHANGSILGLINNDVEVISQEWLSEMVSHVLRPGIGAVGARLLYSDTRVQHAGVVLGIGGVANHAHKFFDSNNPGYFGRARLTQNMAAVTAACLVVRKAIFDQVEGLDEKNLTVAFNDVDFCLKVHECGYRNVYTPYAVLYHHHRPLTIRDGFPWVRSLWRKIYYKVAERGTNSALRNELSGRYFLVPLQTHMDAQIHVHSPFDSVGAFVVFVMQSFALHAPATTVLVIKHHPLDRGRKDIGCRSNQFHGRYAPARGTACTT